MLRGCQWQPLQARALWYLRLRPGVNHAGPNQYLSKADYAAPPCAELRRTPAPKAMPWIGHVHAGFPDRVGLSSPRQKDSFAACVHAVQSWFSGTSQIQFGKESWRLSRRGSIPVTSKEKRANA